MNTYQQITRTLKILRAIGCHQLDTFLPKSRWGLRAILRLNPWRWGFRGKKNRGDRLRNALETLGPVFVKLGQALSTRRDLLPMDIANALAQLQDRVPSFSGEKAQQIIEKAFNQPIETLFRAFNPTALAAASVAQVHEAQLPSGEEVVVKVLRPNIHRVIQQDIALMYTFAKLIERFWAEGYRLRPRELVEEFEQTIQNELDLTLEAANASLLRRNFPDSPAMYVPKIYWDYVQPTALVMERIHGVPIADVETLKQRGTNMKLLAERGVEIFFTQVFRDSFFHADMHPGNLFVDITDPNNPRYKAVDFGIMGSLNRQDQRYLAENLLAFFNRDYRRVAELHVMSGWVPADVRVDQFEMAIRAVCEPINELPLSEISFAKVLLKLFRTASRFRMEVQPQLMLLQKTLFNIEGLGRQLYPELDLWATAKPFLERWIKSQMGVRALWRGIREQLPYWLEKLPELPELVYQALQKASSR